MRVPARLLRMFSALLLMLFLLPLTMSAEGPRFDSLYVFGDSLADIGNDLILSKALGADPAIPPSTSPHRTYFAGRFSNGPVGFEYLWQLLSGEAPGSPNGLKPSLAAAPLGATGAVDFAFGGTGTPYIDQTPGGFFAPGLKGQVELFRIGLRGRRPSKHALYAIVTGANDYRNDPFNVPMDPHDVVSNIADAVHTLYQLGARDVIVLNLPDLGLEPANAGDPGPASALSAFHNALLANALTTLASQLPKLNLIQADFAQAFLQLPAGMNQVVPALDALFPPGFHMSACLFIDPVTCADVPFFDVGDQFLFWDIVHPTTAAHRVLGDYLFQLLVQ